MTNNTTAELMPEFEDWFEENCTFADFTMRNQHYDDLLTYWAFASYKQGRSAAHGEPSKAAPDGWRARLKDMDEASYTYSQYPELAHVIFDSVIDALDELEAASKAGSAEQVSDLAQAFTVDCIGLALDLERQAKRVESQTVERAMKAAAHGLRIVSAALQSAPERKESGIQKILGDWQSNFVCRSEQKEPERKALSDDDILRIFYKEIDGEGFALYEVTPGNMIAFARALLAQASAQSTDAGSVAESDPAIYIFNALVSLRYALDNYYEDAPEIGIACDTADKAIEEYKKAKP